MSIDPYTIKYGLIILALFILGIMVMPRLSGWIFHKHDFTFLYIYFIAATGGLLYYWKWTQAEENSPSFYVYAGFAFIIIFGCVIALGKEKKRNPERKK